MSYDYGNEIIGVWDEGIHPPTKDPDGLDEGEIGDFCCVGDEEIGIVLKKEYGYAIRFNNPTSLDSIPGWYYEVEILDADYNRFDKQWFPAESLGYWYKGGLVVSVCIEGCNSCKTPSQCWTYTKLQDISAELFGEPDRLVREEDFYTAWDDRFLNPESLDFEIGTLVTWSDDLAPEMVSYWYEDTMISAGFGIIVDKHDDQYCVCLLDRGFDSLNVYQWIDHLHLNRYDPDEDCCLGLGCGTKRCGSDGCLTQELVGNACAWFKARQVLGEFLPIPPPPGQLLEVPSLEDETIELDIQLNEEPIDVPLLLELPEPEPEIFLPPAIDNPTLELPEWIDVELPALPPPDQSRALPPG